MTTITPHTDSDSADAIGVERLADDIERLGLAPAALLLLEAHRPLSGLAHALTLIGSPFAALLGGAHFAQRLARLFESPAAIDQLISTLEKRIQTKPVGRQ